MEKFYSVIETQMTNGTAAYLPFIFTSEEQAYAHYHQVASAVYQSTIDYHSVYVIDSDGVLNRDKYCTVVDRREEKTDFYTLVEAQEANGVKAILPPEFRDNNADGMSLFFLKCSYAVIGTADYEGVHLVRSDGTMVEGRVFDKRVEPQPEPNAEA